MRYPRKDEQYMDTRELAARWGLSPRTLESWRVKSTGPRYIKSKGRNAKVLYPMSAIRSYEKKYVMRTLED